MRIGMLALAAVLWLGSTAPAQAADPPEPAIVFQFHPFGRVLDELRAGAELVGGEKAVKAVNSGLKDIFGEKGLEGLDLSRPIVGYVILAPKPQDITAVIALPATSEKDFLELCERTNKRKVTPFGKMKDVYELPPLQDYRGYKALLRFKDQYGYIVYGFNPTPHIAPDALVPVGKIYDPAEKGVIAGRIHFDRIPLTVKLAAPTLFAEVKKTVLDVLELQREEWLTKAIMPDIDKLAVRYLTLAPGADVLTARLNVDIPTGNLVVEAVLNAKPNSGLSKIIAARKPTGNKFGGLITHPDTVAGFKTRLPLFEEEIRAAAAAGLEAGHKEATRNAPEMVKASLEELFKGLGRTVKTGEFDIVGAARGPDKNGALTLVGAVAFEDPAALEKEFKKLMDADPPGEKAKWDVAKVGTVNIHTWKPMQGGFFDITKPFGKADCLVAFAFAPHGVFAAIGPDPIAAVKDALAVKPAESPVLEIVLNPARVLKAMETLDPNAPNFAKLEKSLGKEDKLLSAATLTVEGGKELKVTFKMNLRLLPRLALFEEIEREPRVIEKPPFDKK